MIRAARRLILLGQAFEEALQSAEGFCAVYRNFARAYRHAVTMHLQSRSVRLAERRARRRARKHARRATHTL